jgi:hypothetical protein
VTLALTSTIERRLLVNWRADPDVVAPLLPPGFRPQLVDENAVVGICFLRLAHIHPRGTPDAVGLRSESAAHRIAVERDTPDGVEPCVYVLRRVTNSRAAALAGGRLFPGVHSYARFEVDETADRLDISFATADGQHDAAVSVQVADSLQSSLFPDIASISSFFRGAPVGWSSRRIPGALDGVELVTEQWPMSPAALRNARSNFFGDTKLFPPGSIELDSAVVMRDIPVSWLAAPNAEAVA